MKRRILRNYRLALLSTATVCFPLFSPVTAQEAVWPSNAEAHPGEIVYSRDVPYGTATRRFAQGEASTVAPDQSKLIIDSILVGLEPLSDAEQASVSAPLGGSLATTQSAIDVGLSAISRSGGSGDFARSESGVSATGRIVGQSLSVLPSALGAIAKATGSGQ